MPAWNKRCIVPLQAQGPSADRDGSLTPARSPTAVERLSGNLPESEGACVANADGGHCAQPKACWRCDVRPGLTRPPAEAGSSSSPRPRATAAQQKPDPAAATNAQESRLGPGTEKRSHGAMEPVETKQDQQSQQAEAEQAFPAISADKISLLFQLYEFAKNATDATADTWAAVLSAPTDDVRRWLAWKQAKDGIVRPPAPKRRKVSHQRSSSAASSVKQESPVVASRVVNPNQEGGYGANHAADISPPAHPIEDLPDPVSGTAATSRAAAPAPIMLPPQTQAQPATMNPNDLHIHPPASISRPSSTASMTSAAQNKYPRITVVPRPPSQASTPAQTPTSARSSLPPAYLPPSATSPAVSLYPTSSVLAYASEQAQMMAQPPAQEQRISRSRVDASSGQHVTSYPPALPAGQHPGPPPPPYALAPAHMGRRNSTTSGANMSPATPVSPDTSLFPNVRPSSRSGAIVPSGPFVPSQQQVQQALANGMRAYHNPNVALLPAPIVPTQAPPHPQRTPVQPQQFQNPQQTADSVLLPVPQNARRSNSPGGREYVLIDNTWVLIEHLAHPSTHPHPQSQPQPQPQAKPQPQAQPQFQPQPQPQPQQQQSWVPMQQQQRLHHAGHVPGTLAPQFAPAHSQQRLPVGPARPQAPTMPQQLVRPPPRPVAPSAPGPHPPRSRRNVPHKGFSCRDPDELLLAPPAEQLAYCVDERQHWIDELECDEARTEPGYADNCRIRIRAVDAWIAELMRRGLVAPPSRFAPPRPAVATAQRQVAAARPGNGPAQPHAVSASASREVIVIPDTPEPPPSQALHDEAAGPSQQQQPAQHLPTPAPTAVAPGAVAVTSRPASAVPERAPGPSLQITTQPAPAAKGSPAPATAAITVEEQMQQRDAVFAYLDACARSPLDIFVAPPPLRFEPHSSRGEHRASVAPYVDEWRRLHAPGAALLKHISAHQRRALAPPSPETPAGQLPPGLPALQLRTQPMDVDASGPSVEGGALGLRARSTGAHGIVTPDATPEPAPRPDSQAQALASATPAAGGLFKDLLSIFEKIEAPRSLSEDGMDTDEHMRTLARLNPDKAAEVRSAKQLDDILQSHVEKSNYILAAIERGALSHLGFPASRPSTSSAPSPAL